MIEITTFMFFPLEPSTDRPLRVISMELDAYHGETLRDLYHGLLEKKETLDNSEPIQTPEDAIRWLLESVRTAQEDYEEDNG